MDQNYNTSNLQNNPQTVDNNGVQQGEPQTAYNNATPQGNTQGTYYADYASGNNQGTYDQGVYNQGTYNQETYNQGAYNQETYNQGTQQDIYKQSNDIGSKRATQSMIWGIVTLSLNLIMICSMSLGGPFLFGGILCIGPIVGISYSVAGWNSDNHGKAVAGRVCSIIALVLGVIVFIVGIISRFSSY